MDDFATYRRVLRALQIVRAGLLVYVLTAVMAVVSARVDGPSHVFVTLYRASVVALAVISALGMARFALASPWRARAAVIGTIGYGLVAIAQTYSMLGAVLPQAYAMVLGLGIITGFAGSFVVIHTVAHALELRRLAFAVSLLGFAAAGGLCVLAKAHADSVLAGAYLLVVMGTCLVGLTLVIGALRTRVADLPHAVIHAR